MRIARGPKLVRPKGEHPLRSLARLLPFEPGEMSVRPMPPDAELQDDLPFISLALLEMTNHLKPIRKSDAGIFRNVYECGGIRAAARKMKPNSTSYHGHISRRMKVCRDSVKAILEDSIMGRALVRAHLVGKGKVGPKKATPKKPLKRR